MDERLRLCVQLQDVPPTEISPHRLASIATVGDMLAAVPSAHEARVAMLAGSQPSTHVIREFGSMPGSLPPASPSVISCRELKFSPDGQYLAANFSRYVHSNWTKSGWVVVLQVADAYRQTAHIHLKGDAKMRICWAPDAPHLSVVGQAPSDESESALQEPSCLKAVVLDAITGTLLHDVSFDCRSVSLDAGSFTCHNATWCPSGRRLLVYCRPSCQRQGVLVVLDMQQGVPIVQCTVQESQQLHAIALWHPSSEGLVMSATVELQAPAAFLAAGIALGTLPEPLGICSYLRLPGFSPCGQKLIACEQHCPWEGGSDAEEEYYNRMVLPEFNFTILRCSRTGLGFEFQHQQSLRGHSIEWLPCSTKCLLDRVGHSHNPTLHQVVDLTVPGGTHMIRGLRQPIRCSPSGRLVADSSICRPFLVDLDAGAPFYNIQNESHGDIEQLCRGDGISCKTFLPSGRGIACVKPRQGSMGLLHIFLFA